MRNDMGYVLKTGAVIGALVGTLATILAVSVIWLADTKAGTDNTARLAAPIALVCLGGSVVSVMLLYAVRYGRVVLAPVLRQNQVDEWASVAARPEWEQEIYDTPADEYQRELENSPVIDAIQPDVQLRAVVECVIEQLTAHYQYATNPSRKLFEDQGTPQPIWNTARGILKRAGFVDDKGRLWAGLPWEIVRQMLDRIRPEGDSRIWMPTASGRGLVNVVLSSQIQTGNSYLAPSPTE